MPRKKENNQYKYIALENDVIKFLLKGNTLYVRCEYPTYKLKEIVYIKESYKIINKQVYYYLEDNKKIKGPFNKASECPKELCFRKLLCTSASKIDKDAYDNFLFSNKEFYFEDSVYSISGFDKLDENKKRPHVTPLEYGETAYLYEFKIIKTK